MAALELCSDSSSRAMSPRISFSHDLSQSDIVPVEHLLCSFSSSSSSTLDFNFCTPLTPDHHYPSSMADELFSNGKILPTQIKKLPSPPPPPPTPLPLQILKPLPSQNGPNLHQEDADQFKTPEEKQNSKSFWGFKRSSSCGNGYARTLCPLPLLSRSNSTGSSTCSKRSTSSSSKDHVLNHKQHHSQKALFSSQKPPLKKTTYGSYGNPNNGVRVNPVLNVPSANIFGLGSIFSSGKDKNKRK